MHFTNRVAFALGTLLVVGWVAGPASADQATEGKAIFMQYCASCHGPRGAGNGPLAATLTMPPANLCLLSQRFGNPLPQDIMERFIDGRADGKLMARATCQCRTSASTPNQMATQPKSNNASQS